jgi:ParB family chromosome partitioning protein
VHAEQPVTLPISAICADPNQPRKYFEPKSLKALSENIKHHGLLQPITVRPSDNSNGKYLIVCGERRFRAHKMAGLEKITCFVKQPSEDEVRNIQLIENLERNNLLPIELALEFQKRIKNGQTQEQIAKAIGRSRGFVEQRLALLKLPQPVQQLLAEGKISFTKARSLLAISTSQDSTVVVKHQRPCSKSKTNIDTGVSKTACEVINVQSLALGKLLTSRAQVTRSELWQAIDKDITILRGA